jgi:hypothetical protein
MATSSFDPLKLGAKPISKPSGGFDPFALGAVKVKPTAPVKYDVPESASARKNKVAGYKQEEVAAKTESKKANSATGFLKNFSKALIENIAPSEVGLGKTIGKVFGNQSETYSQTLQGLNASQVDLRKRIRENEAKGKDTTKLKQMYNENLPEIQKLERSLGEESKLPSTFEVAGQIGGTALDVATAGTYGKAKTGVMSSGRLAQKGAGKVKAAVTGVSPELGKIAEQKASGIFTKKGAGNVAKGAGIGYAFDVTQGAQGNRGEERDGVDAFKPGFGTALGAGIPAIAEGVQSVKNAKGFFTPEKKAERLVRRREKELDKLVTIPLKKTIEKGRQRGIEVKKVLAETDVLHGAVDNTGTINTKGKDGAVEQYTHQFVDGNEAIVSDALKKEGVSVSLDLVKNRLVNAIKKEGIEGAALVAALRKVDDEIGGYALRASGGGAVPLATLHDAKINKYNNINFFTESNAKQYDKTIARTLKELVQENTKSIDVENVNKELAKHFAVIDFLKKLDGRKVEGGRLGKYFAKTVGAVVGSHFGPLGSLAGAEIAGNIKGRSMSRAFNGRTNKQFEQPQVIKDALNFTQSKPLSMGGASVVDGVESAGKANKSRYAPKAEGETVRITRYSEKPATPKNPDTKVPKRRPGQEAYGAGAGFEKDEEGNIKFDPTKAALGIAGMAGAKRLRSELPRTVTAEKLAKVMDKEDIQIVKKFLTGKMSPQEFKKAETVISAMRLDNVEGKLQARFLKDIVDLAQQRLGIDPQVAAVSLKKGAPKINPDNVVDLASTKVPVNKASRYTKALNLDKHGTPTSPNGKHLADPVEGGIYYHGTIKENKQSLLKNGFNPKLNKKGFAEQGEAFYIGDYSEASGYGDDMVGVRVKKGQEIKTLDASSKEWAEVIGKSTSKEQTAEGLRELRRRGYDAVNSGKEIEILNPNKFEIIDAKKDKSLFEQVTGKKPPENVSRYTKGDGGKFTGSSKVKAEEFVNDAPIKVFRGEGKGIGNSTLVNGQYFADSKKFASTFGDVSEEVIPKGSKIFNLDAVKTGEGSIPHKLLVDQKALTKYLIDKGYDYTKNTNTRGVEYVKLNRIASELDDLAGKSKSLAEFKKTVMDNYPKYRDEIARLSKNYTNADHSRMRSPIEDIYNKINGK